MNWEWLFGKKEKVCECPCVDTEPVEFEGTTTELLSQFAALPPQAFAPPIQEEIMEPSNESSNVDEQRLSERDQMWLNLDILKMAFEIETSRKQKMLFYLDVGKMPKKTAEAYVKDQKALMKDKDGDFWLQRKEGGRGTEVTLAPGRVTLEGVLETAGKLKEFIASK